MLIPNSSRRRSPEMQIGVAADRSASLHRGLRLEYFTMTWNAIEAAIGLVAGIAAGSVALVSSLSIQSWKRRREASCCGDSGRRLMAAGPPKTSNVEQSGWSRSPSSRSPRMWVGALPSTCSRRLDPKRESGRDRARPRLAHRHADPGASKEHCGPGTRQSGAPSGFNADDALHVSSAILLFGLVTNALFGWWWADPIAGLGIAAFAAKEGGELWTTKDLCCR